MNYIRLALRAVKSLMFCVRVFFKPAHADPDALVIIFNRHNLKYWLASDPGMKDRIAYGVLVRQGFRVNVLFNPRMEEILAQSSQAVVWLNPHHFIFSTARRENDYRSQLHSLLDELGSHFRSVIPRPGDIRFWENKVYMHEKLRELALRHPKTLIVERASAHDWGAEAYPLILKTEDGYSSNGLWLCRKAEDVPHEVLKSDRPILLQEFLNITFDIRVICVHGRAVSFYWRVNSKQEHWQPTATQNGATVCFVDLPPSVERLAESIYARTGCITYGADICFKDDDIASEPYILEFSPVYQPNPAPPASLVTTNYSSFKKASWVLYDEAFEDLNWFLFSHLAMEERKFMRKGA